MCVAMQALAASGVSDMLCPVAFSPPLLTFVFPVSFEAGSIACGFQHKHSVDLGFTGVLCMCRALEPSVCVPVHLEKCWHCCQCLSASVAVGDG